MELGAGLGIPEDEMVHAIINPVTKRPISPITLRKYFRDELDRGLIRVKLKAGANLLAMTANNAACAIFFAKCRLGFNERASWHTPGGQPWRPAGNPDPFEGQPADLVSAAEGKSMTEIARRIAWTLTMGTETTTTSAPVPAKEPGKNRVKKPVKKQPQPV